MVGAFLFVITILLLIVYFSVSGTIKYKNELEIILEHEVATTTPFLHEEEVVLVTATSTATTTESVILPIEKVLFEYVEVIDG